MPKERRQHFSRLSSVPCSSSTKQSLLEDPLENDNNIKEWEDARCPVCMEHPHNAILLICSSHEKGCRPFMCDTSYRHSNCFDQFRTTSGETSATVQGLEDAQAAASPLTSTPTISEAALLNLEGERTPGRPISMHAVPCENPEKPKLVCPLCRGLINGWTIVKNARCFMNAKSRSCACETCDFSGTYEDLRKHARLVHPLVRPTAVDPERQRSWRRLERQRDLGDLLSTLQSSFGEEVTTTTTEESTSTLAIEEGGWLTVFFLVRLIRPGTSSSRSRTSRTRGQLAVRRRSSRRLWGESYDGDSDPRDEDDGSAESVQGITRRNVRRRLNPENDDEFTGSGEGFPRQ